MCCSNADVDYVVHIDAIGLSPRTRYAYAFEADGVRSRVGKTKTAPAEDDPAVGSIKVATFSCACHWCGFLNGYREIAADPDVDIVLGLGDWLYPRTYIYIHICSSFKQMIMVLILVVCSE